MGTSNNWLEKRKKRERLLARIQNIAIGSLIAAITIGPLIYFAAVAVPLELRESRRPSEFSTQQAATPDVATVLDLAATPEISVSDEPIKFDEKTLEKTTKEKEKEDILDSKKGDLKVELELEDLPGDLKDRKISENAISIETEEKTINTLTDEFNLREELKIKTFTKEDENKNTQKFLVSENLEIQDGPRKVQKKDDAETVAIAALKKYLKTLDNSNDFDVVKDSSKIKTSAKKTQLVLAGTKTNNQKWYVTFQQYEQGLPVFDGNIKMVFTERKMLLVISDNIRQDIPAVTEFAVSSSFAQDQMKEVFDWDESLDKIDFTDKGYYKNKPAYRIEAATHNPLGEWDVLVDGETGEVHKLESTISLQDSWIPPDDYFEAPVDDITPIPESNMPPPLEGGLDLPAIPRQFQNLTSQTFEEPAPITQEPATPTPTIDYSSTPEPLIEEQGTAEPEIIILDTIFSQVLGKIFPKSPADDPVVVPFENEYIYYNSRQFITDEGGYFENKDLEWYSVFLEGPYVRIHDDLATSDAEIKDRTPEDPFVWDEYSGANPEAVNAFYHTNKIRKYFNDELNFAINKQVDLTVNSELVEQYLDGCGAWFDNSQKTIEMGAGGGVGCPEDLNYALGSDVIYHEYAHYAIEEVTHLPNIAGSESAAMAEGLADYFAATINNDPLWGEVISPNRTRNLQNNLNFQTDMIGQSHHDGQIFSGALWDLREAIGQEATDKLVFNTLYQDRLHFETFMYGMIIEDDDDNDFSNGTPHIVAIIRAFENHGIGPGVDNFDGLPITPETWTQLLNETPPEGVDDPLFGAHYPASGACNPSGSILYVSGGTCYVYGTETWTDIYVYSSGTLQVGYSSYPSTATTLNITGTLYVYATGKVYIGSSTDAFTNYSRINATGSMVLSASSSSAGGIIQAFHSASYSNYFYGTSAITVNGNTNDANIWLYDNATSSANSLNLYGNVSIGNLLYGYNSYLDINGTTNIYTGGNLYLANATTYFYTDYLNNGNNTFAGGNITNNGYLYVYYNAYFGNGSTTSNNYRFNFNFNTSASVLYYTTLYNGATFTNNGTYFYIYGRFTMYDESSFTNDGTAYVLDNFNMMNLSYAAYPDLYNNGTLYIDATVRGDSASVLNVYDRSTVDNTGTIRAVNYVRLGGAVNDQPTFTNSGNLYIGWTGSASEGTATNRLYVYNDSTFTNTSTGVLEIDRNGTVAQDGNLHIHPNSTDQYDSPYFSNQGTVNVASLTVGGYTGVNAFTTFSNGATGTIRAYYTGSSFPGLDINNGARFDQYNDLTINGYVNIDGQDAVMNARMDNYGGTVDVDGTFTLSTNYSTYNNDNNGTTTIDGDMTLNDGSHLTNGDATYTSSAITIGPAGAASLNVFESSDVINYGTITVNDDINMGGEISSISSILNYNDIIATASTSNTLNMMGNNRFYNYNAGASVNISYNSGSDTDGIIKVSNDSKFVNFDAASGTPTVQAHKILIGDSGTSTDGGQFYNLRGGVVQVSSGSSTALDLYKGDYFNGFDIYSLAYDGQTTNFTLGTILTGGTNGAKGLIIADSGAGSSTTGTLFLATTSGSFTNNETITDDNAGPLYNDLTYTSQTANFTVGATLTGGTSGAIAEILADNDAGTSGRLKIRQISGTFSIFESLNDSSGGQATSSSITLPGTVGTAVVNGEEVLGYSGSAANTAVSGWIDVRGSDGSAAGQSYFHNRALSSGNLDVYSYATATIDRGTHTGSNCRVYSNLINDIQNGWINVAVHNTDYTPTANSTLTCTTTYVGGIYNPGVLSLYDDDATHYAGRLTGTDVYVYEDGTNNDTDTELSIARYSDLAITSSLNIYGQVVNNGDVSAQTMQLYDEANYDNGYNGIAYAPTTTIASYTFVYGDPALDETNFDNYGTHDTLWLRVDAGGRYNNYSSGDLVVNDWLRVHGGRLDQASGSTIDVAGLSEFYEDTTYDTGDVNIDGDYTTDQMWIGDIDEMFYSGADVDVTGNGYLKVTNTGTQSAGIYKRSDGNSSTAFANLGNTGHIDIDGRLTMWGQDVTRYAHLQNGSGGATTPVFSANDVYLNSYSDIQNYAIFGDVGGGYSGYAINNITGGAASGDRNFTNNSTGQVDAANITVQNLMTFSNYNNVNVDSITRVYQGGTLDNYDTWDTDQLNVGWYDSGTPSNSLAGGTLNNRAGGNFDVNGVGTSVAQIWFGTINLLSGSSGFDVAGRMSIRGDYEIAGNKGVIDATDGTSGGRPTSTYGELYMYENSQYFTEDSITVSDAILSGDFYMEGMNASLPADFQLNYSALAPNSTRSLVVNGDATIGDYANFYEYAPVDPSIGYFGWNGGLRVAHDTTVSTNGLIESDTSSLFYFEGSVTTDGTVNLRDHVRVGSTYTQTGGSTIFGDETNVGYAYIEGKLTVSDGTFTTYNQGDNVADGGLGGDEVYNGWLDIEVSGSGTTFEFANDDGTSGLDCLTDIHGGFDILDDAVVYVNCETVPAVKVHAGSPGGTTLVQGIMYLNTNLETDDMIIGDGTAGGAGLITHDVISDTGWNPDPATVFVLSVLDSFTLKANSFINVNSKYGTDSTTGSDNRGGTNGGRGQYNLSTGSPITEINSAQVTYESGLGSLNFYMQTFDFVLGETITGATSGATAVIVHQFDSGGTGNLTLTEVHGVFEDDEYINGSVTGVAKTNGTVTQSQRSIHAFGTCGMNMGGSRCAGAGGGIVHIYVGDEHASTDNMTIETGSLITASGASVPIGGGSGGTINIVAKNRIIGGGAIIANGGGSTATTGWDTAGGGGRIFIEYYDEDTFGTDFTGGIAAIGGNGAVGGVYGGAGTITKIWNNPWANQKDPVVIIDGFDGAAGGTYQIDVAGNGVGTVSTNELTAITWNNTTPGYESVQIENGAQVGIQEGLKLQQCLLDSDAYFYALGTGIVYNREHTTYGTNTCIASPDPVGTLHINNSSTGTSTGLEGEQDDTIPHIQDLTPYMSGIHYDGRFDSDNSLADASPQNANLAQIQIATSEHALFAYDDTIVTDCDWEFTINQSDSGARQEIEMDPDCAANLTGAPAPGQRYYYRIRFREDTGATDVWGLWSEMNNFYIDESGILDLISCGGTFSGKFDIGTYDSSTGDNYDSDYCNFETEATAPIYIKASKDQRLTSTTNSDVSIWDMNPNDYDPPDATDGMDGETDTAGDYDNEVGFHLLSTSINNPPFQVQISYAGTYYHMNYTFLPDSPTTIMTSSTGYSNETFIMYLAAYIHGLIPHPTDPINNDPTGTCGYTDPVLGDATHDTCTTPSGTYTGTVTLTASTSP
jgi:hypothetical protein